MKKQFLKFITVKRSGFTIVESLFSLVVVAMATFLIATFFTLLLRDVHHQDETTNFYLYLNELEKRDYRMAECTPHRIYLIDHQNKHRYQIKFFKHSIILTGPRFGYVPLLRNVDHLDYSYQKDILRSRITMMNQQRFSAKSWVKKCSKKDR